MPAWILTLETHLSNVSKRWRQKLADSRTDSCLPEGLEKSDHYRRHPWARTKLAIAQTLGIHNTIGYDLVGMNERFNLLRSQTAFLFGLLRLRSAGPQSGGNSHQRNHRSLPGIGLRTVGRRNRRDAGILQARRIRFGRIRSGRCRSG